MSQIMGDNVCNFCLLVDTPAQTCQWPSLLLTCSSLWDTKLASDNSGGSWCYIFPSIATSVPLLPAVEPLQEQWVEDGSDN